MADLVLGIILLVLWLFLYLVLYIKSPVTNRKPENEEVQLAFQNGNKNKVKESTLIITCTNPNCRQKLRIPKIKKTLKITCPICRNTFYYPEMKEEVSNQKTKYISETSELPPEPESKKEYKNEGEESTIIITCTNPNCKQKLKIPNTKEPLKITCPTCRNTFYYPELKEETSKTQQVADKKYCAYLDIETTSLNPHNGELTVIGLCLDDGNEHRVIQLVGNDITASKLIEIMNNVEVLYTYNGARFDIPYIKAKLGIDLSRYFVHKDLMKECWRRNLYGGLKEVERKLGIGRKLTGVDGRVAVQLWRNYRFYGDKNSLKTLLEYNKEDVLNLRILRQKLNIYKE